MTGGAQTGIGIGDFLGVQGVRIVAFRAGTDGFGMFESAHVGFAFILIASASIRALVDSGGPSPRHASP